VALVLGAALVVSVGAHQARQTRPPAAPPATQGPDRTKAPALGPTPSLKVPLIQKRALANGLPVWIVEMHKVPVVDFALLVKAGSGADPVNKFGLANFTASLMNEGAGTRSSLEMADAIEFIGASLAAGSSFDASTVRLHVAASKLDDGLALMADVTLRPTFAPAELDRVRKTRVTALNQAKDSPAALIALAFPRILYGPTHRYGTGQGGTETTMTAFTVADLKSFHDTYYQPANAHLLVVGDITAAAAMPKLEKAFGAWKNTVPAPKTTVPVAVQHGARQIYLIDKPKAPQSQIRTGWVGVPRSTPDYFAIQVLNTILGGSYTSRLNQNLRQEHGYTYGASSAFDMRLSAGPFFAAAGVQTDKTVESVREFFKELDGIRQPVPVEELARERNLVALSFPGTFEATTSMAGHLADLVIYGLPETYFNEYVAKIQAVTAPDLERVAKQYIQADRFAIVIIGDLATIEKPLRDANIAPVKVLTMDEIMK
jgi:predicted Zn-dependent peptidase